MAKQKKSEPEVAPDDSANEVAVVGDGIEAPQEDRYVSPEVALAMSGNHVAFDLTLPDIQNGVDHAVPAPDDNTED